VEDDVYGWRYALLVVHARKEEEEWPVRTLHCHISTIGCNALCHMDTDFIRQEKGKERKSIYIAPFCTKVHSKRSGVDHTVLPAKELPIDHSSRCMCADVTIH